MPSGAPNSNQGQGLGDCQISGAPDVDLGCLGGVYQEGILRGALYLTHGKGLRYEGLRACLPGPGASVSVVTFVDKPK